jgi:glyoxylase-like metal-dependent hydrolase (beta-lactamase superfamily II)
MAGDMCSDIEIPLLDLEETDPLADYVAGLGRLAALPVQVVIPGHGAVGDAAEFRRRVTADEAYLDALASGAQVDDPRLEVDWLRAEHAKHVQRVRP